MLSFWFFEKVQLEEQYSSRRRFRDPVFVIAALPHPPGPREEIAYRCLEPYFLSRKHYEEAAIRGNLCEFDAPRFSKLNPGWEHRLSIAATLALDSAPLGAYLTKPYPSEGFLITALW